MFCFLRHFIFCEAHVLQYFPMQIHIQNSYMQSEMKFAKNYIYACS